MDPPPPTLQRDDPAAAERARQRLTPKNTILRVFSRKRLRPSSSAPQLATDAHQLNINEDDNLPISLDSSTLIPQDNCTDRYEWAILYENQRGMTVFSIPYYSSLSLLPSDPSPYTLPNASPNRSEQPPLSLDNYPLPDGNWHWVSRCWMIDMRSDSGEVQHDGFEYNWVFRKHNWRAQVGSFSFGGWVRRRRWVRLMVRPAKPWQMDYQVPGTPASVGNKDSTHWRHRQSMTSYFPPSVNTGLTDLSDWANMDPDEVWLSEDPEANWQRCRAVMRRFARDGQKLELWRLWVGAYHPEHKDKFSAIHDKGKRREKQWTEDDAPLPSEAAAADVLTRESVALAPRELVVAVLRIHAQHLLHMFVFPESRAQFLKLLRQSDILPEINDGLEIIVGTSEVDFWSYSNDLADHLNGGSVHNQTAAPELAKDSSRSEQRSIHTV